MSKVYNVVSSILGVKLRCCGSLIKKLTITIKLFSNYLFTAFYPNFRKFNREFVTNVKNCTKIELFKIFHHPRQPCLILATYLLRYNGK
jgi:hypothetical protein